VDNTARQKFSRQLNLPSMQWSLADIVKGLNGANSISLRCYWSKVSLSAMEASRVLHLGTVVGGIWEGG
jgi:hypothetical protein